jgi:CRISPR-associated protein Cas5h
MEVLCFKIKGKFAHFRKYYANNTAFSFTIPPRTALMGIVAAALGWPRDSYYEKMSSANLNFGIRVLSPLKKSFHRLNLLSIKTSGDISKNLNSDFRGAGGRIQTPFEVVSGLNLRTDEVGFQVFLKSNGVDELVFDEIKQHFLTNNSIYNISLGTANFSASIYDIELVSGTTKGIGNDFVLMNSAVPSAMVEELQFNKAESNQYNYVEEDLLPGEFVANGNREVKKMNRLLFSTTNLALRVRLKQDHYQIETKSGPLNIQFMDA